MEWMVATWAASLRAKRRWTERRARPTAGTFLVSKHLTWGERERERERERGVSGGGGVREGRRRRGGAHARAGGPRTGLAPGWRGGGDHLASASARARAHAVLAFSFLFRPSFFFGRLSRPRREPRLRSFQRERRGRHPLPSDRPRPTSPPAAAPRPENKSTHCWVQAPRQAENGVGVAPAEGGSQRGQAILLVKVGGGGSGVHRAGGCAGGRGVRVA